jgi:transposase
LLPPSLREWLSEDHLAWFVLDAVEEIDLSAFYDAYREDGWGRAAFDPRMMVALLLYAYAIGERSSRGFERRCREDVAFRVITANRLPDHATIARLRARHDQALAETFTQVLVVCGGRGWCRWGWLRSTAASWRAMPRLGRTRSYASIREEVEEMLAQAARADTAEDEQLGDRRGDELPPEFADARSRRQRLRRLQEQPERA